MAWSTTAGVKRMYMDVYKPVKCKSFGTVTLDAYILYKNAKQVR